MRNAPRRPLASLGLGIVLLAAPAVLPAAPAGAGSLPELEAGSCSLACGYRTPAPGPRACGLGFELALLLPGLQLLRRRPRPADPPDPLASPPPAREALARAT